MLSITPKSATPIYEQLVNEVKRMIRVGELKIGDSLPPIRTLAKQLDVSVATVARAYQELYNLDLIEGNRRKGSYVKQRPLAIDEDQSRLFKEPILMLVRQGFDRLDIERIFHSNLTQIFD
jgi:GntR family transcriptional regulator